MAVRDSRFYAVREREGGGGGKKERHICMSVDFGRGFLCHYICGDAGVHCIPLHTCVCAHA